MEKGHSISVLDHGYVRLVDFMGTDQSIINAARTSYHSASKGEEADKKLLNYLYKNRHTSPFEMCKIVFNIKMPIFVMRQFVRHRMQNLNEVSARYTELPEEFYIPEKWRAQDTKNKQGSVSQAEWDVEREYLSNLGIPIPKATQHDIFNEAVATQCTEAYEIYTNLLNAGVAREMARFVLPVNIYTEIVCCWDLKNLMYFFSLRDDPHAQWEIQQFSIAMKIIARDLFPWTMEAYDRYQFHLMDTNDLKVQAP